jgi:hypothetical protein
MLHSCSGGRAGEEVAACFITYYSQLLTVMARGGEGAEASDLRLVAMTVLVVSVGLTSFGQALMHLEVGLSPFMTPFLP